MTKQISSRLTSEPAREQDAPLSVGRRPNARSL